MNGRSFLSNFTGNQAALLLPETADKQTEASMYPLTHPIVDNDGNVTDNHVASREIKRTISQKVVSRKWGRTWINEEVELTDGGNVTIRTVTQDEDSRLVDRLAGEPVQAGEPIQAGDITYIRDGKMYKCPTGDTE